MDISRALLCLTAAALITAGFIATRLHLSDIPGLKNKWTEKNEARWLEFRACCGECMVLSGAALFASVITNSPVPAAVLLPLCTGAGLLKIKNIFNKIR